MKIVTIDDAENVILGLQDEIRRSEESRYDHRLHGVLLVAYGMNCCQVADLLGDAHERWPTGWRDSRKRVSEVCMRDPVADGLRNWMLIKLLIYKGYSKASPVTWDCRKSMGWKDDVGLPTKQAPSATWSATMSASTARMGVSLPQAASGNRTL